MRIERKCSFGYPAGVQGASKGGDLVKRLWLAAPALVLALFVATTATAAKPGPGTSTGTAKVFVPNPVQSTGNETLTDQKDSDAAVPASAYYSVTLTNLDGSGFLRGDWANVVSETGNPAYSPTNTFIYTRRQDEFEQVMAYYWVTEAQKYIQSLGFGSTLPAVNKESQDVRINQWGDDNSFETDHPKDELRFGKGGVDDAEDAEVILHEYGHAIHDGSGFIFASEEAGAISEGFGDYWAVDGLGHRRPPARRARAHAARVRDGLGRDVLHVRGAALPAPPRQEPAVPGRPRRRGARRRPDLVARALGHPQSLGYVKADTVILKGQFDFAGTTMTDLATRTVAAARSLYGNGRREGQRRVRGARDLLATSRASRAALRARAPQRTGRSSHRRARATPARGSRRRCSASSPRRSPSRARRDCPT